MDINYLFATIQDILPWETLYLVFIIYSVWEVIISVCFEAQNSSQITWHTNNYICIFQFNN